MTNEEQGMPDKVRLTCYVTPAIRDLAHKLKKLTGRSISCIVERAILEWDRREGEHRADRPRNRQDRAMLEWDKREDPHND